MILGIAGHRNALVYIVYSLIVISSRSLQSKGFRNIRPLPCVSKSTGGVGVCMFAWDCMKNNGTHLGTCIDRFYFGSCCVLPGKETELSNEVIPPPNKKPSKPVPVNTWVQNTSPPSKPPSATVPVNTLSNVISDGSGTTMSPPQEGDSSIYSNVTVLSTGTTGNGLPQTTTTNSPILVTKANETSQVTLTTIPSNPTTTSTSTIQNTITTTNPTTFQSDSSSTKLSTEPELEDNVVDITTTLGGPAYSDSTVSSTESVTTHSTTISINDNASTITTEIINGTTEPLTINLVTTTESTTMAVLTPSSINDVMDETTVPPSTQDVQVDSSTTFEDGMTETIAETTFETTTMSMIPTTTNIATLSTLANITLSTTNVLDDTTTMATPTTTLDPSDYRQVCGKQFYSSGRIVGGAKAEFGEWPWQVSLRQWRGGTFLHKCGAALLNENWVATAAHCVENIPPDEILLRLGEYDLGREDEPYGYVEKKVQIIASHPQFESRTFEYDLALLRFFEPVKFQPNIIPICIPETDYTFVGDYGYVTGWGRLYEDGPLPSVLQEVSVPVINNSICESMYLSAGYTESIPHIFLCAGTFKGGMDSCEGDSGGPLVIQMKNGKWYLAGIISWGIGCAEPNQPGVYTRISEFRDWINQILQF